MPVNFFNEDHDFLPANQLKLIAWLERIATNYAYKISDLNYILCSDEFLLNINKQYLNHDYYTDIITFDHADEKTCIAGDIFISIDRAQENSAALRHSFDAEFHRLLVHGLLHLLGFNDKTDAEKKVMTEKEEACLSLLNN